MAEKLTPAALDLLDARARDYLRTYVAGLSASWADHHDAQGVRSLIEEVRQLRVSLDAAQRKIAAAHTAAERLVFRLAPFLEAAP